MYCSRAVIPHMLERDRGKIINVTSGFGLRAGRNNFIYTSAKAGLINFTRSLTMTYAPAIQANLIAPGLFPHGDSWMSEWWKHGKFVPMARLGEDEELGPLCVFLASDLTSYMNGQIIVLDGGGLAGGQLPTGFAPVVPLETRLMVAEQFSLAGKSALVIGASNPLGRAAAVALAEAGADVGVATTTRSVRARKSPPTRAPTRSGRSTAKASRRPSTPRTKTTSSRWSSALSPSWAGSTSS